MLYEYTHFAAEEYGDADADQNFLDLTTVEIPVFSPWYLPPTAAWPPLKTARCEPTFCFAFSYACLFLTRGFRPVLFRRGVRPRFFSMARVSARGPSAVSSSNDALRIGSAGGRWTEKRGR